MKNRYERLFALAERQGLDAVALAPGANQFYFAGAEFHLSERPTLVFFSADGSIAGVVPTIERDVFESLEWDAEGFFWSDGQGYASAFAAMFAKRPFRKIGVEGQTLRFFEAEAMREASPALLLTDVHQSVGTLRLAKERDELEKLRQAVRISERALENVLREIRSGMSEARIRGMLINALFEEGAEGIAFPPIVAVGANSANPHAQVSENSSLGKGDALLIDCGATFRRYHADVTRTFFCGTPEPQDAALYETVLEANREGVRTAGPNVEAHSIDDAVQKALEASDFAEGILHKTGHGLGLEVHEEPHVIRGNRVKLPKGCVFTVEPGLYFPDRIGVRIEDDVVITSEGRETLTSFDKELIALPV